MTKHPDSITLLRTFQVFHPETGVLAFSINIMNCASKYYSNSHVFRRKGATEKRDDIYP